MKIKLCIQIQSEDAILGVYRSVKRIRLVPALHGTKSVLMKSILMTDKIVVGIQIVI